MRAVAAVCVAALWAGLAACDEGASPTPLSAGWLEWSDSVTAGSPFGVRVSGRTFSHPPRLRIRVRVAGDTVTIEPFSLIPPCRGTCPDVAYAYDTLVWVPAITASSARTVTLRAFSDFHETAPPWPMRTFGTVVVTPDTPLAGRMHAVGVASGFEDSFGCFLVIPGPPARVYVSRDQPPAWAPGFTGFVYGRVDLSLASACRDDAYVIEVDSIVG